MWRIGRVARPLDAFKSRRLNYLNDEQLEKIMILTVEQQQAIQSGQAVTVTVAGAPCVVMRQDVYERGDALELTPWTAAEMNLLASETAALLAGDGLDEPDDA